MKIYSFAPLAARPYPTINDINNKYIYGGIDLVINVSEKYSIDIHQQFTAKDIDYIWLPMNETSKDMGLTSILTACIFIYQAHLENKKVVVHCYGGNNRSRVVCEAYHFLLNLKQLDDEYKECINHLVYNCETEHLPTLVTMEKILKRMNIQLQNKEIDLQLL